MGSKKVRSQRTPFNRMNKLKPIIITAVIALAAVAIALRVPQLRRLVGF